MTRAAIARAASSGADHADQVEQAKQLVIAHMHEHGTVDVATMRDKMQVSRKYALAVLEYFDDIGITKRVGNDRILV